MNHHRSMLSAVKACLPVLLGMALLGAGSAACAGEPAVVVVFGPAAISAVPTLSETMLMALALLVAVVAWRGLRDKNIGKPLATLLLAGALMLGSGSSSLIRSALASVAESTFSIDNGANVSVSVSNLNSDSPIRNIGAKSASVISVMVSNARDSSLIDPTTGPKCVPGLIVAPNASCVVKLQQPG